MNRKNTPDLIKNENPSFPSVRTLFDMNSAQRIIEGLKGSPRSIDCIFFYDTRGSKLFEQITTLPEYYLTRVELTLLKQISSAMKRMLINVDIIELGSGDCRKISLLLKAVDPQNLKTIRYFPVDVSPSALIESEKNLIKQFNGLRIEKITADFCSELHMIPDERKRIFLFLGSTIGNMSPSKRSEFLKKIKNRMKPGEKLITGIDLVKEDTILEAAYNDSQKLTAEFNLNILSVANSIAGTNFVCDDFIHKAFYNHHKSRIEMHLQSTRDMNISTSLLPHTIEIKKGETIHTENSYKFSPSRFAWEAALAGLKTDSFITDPGNHYALVLLTKKEAKES